MTFWMISAVVVVGVLITMVIRNAEVDDKRRKQR